MTRTAIISHHLFFFFYDSSIFWKTLFVSLPSLLDVLSFVLILSISDCNVDISKQLLYLVNDLVLCRMSNPAEILTVYIIMLEIRCFP